MEDTAAVSLKQKVYAHFGEAINKKVCLLKQMLDELIESTRNETKSSAGDKYETGRAMLQIEQDNVRKQLREALEQKAAFDAIDITAKVLHVASGSLVKTNRGYLFLSIAMGKANIDGCNVIALSPQSPLGNKLPGLQTGATVTINDTSYTIESIE